MALRRWMAAACLCAAALAAGAQAPSVDADAQAGAERLVAAYGDFLAGFEAPNTIRWKDGSVTVYDDGVEKRDYEDLLERASLRDQMSIPYPEGWPVDPPELNEDPGRPRNEAFFRKMYGDSKEEVERNLVTVPWAPSGESLRFSRVNGAAEALRNVGEEIAALPADVRRYVEKSRGTFVWRPIAGTGRLSMHSFGIAVDFKLPVAGPEYWLWERSSGRDARAYPAAVLRDDKLGQVVRIFEKHGFIWGGKWYHFDLMHFEYRPELVRGEGESEN